MCSWVFLIARLRAKNPRPGVERQKDPFMRIPVLLISGALLTAIAAPADATDRGFFVGAGAGQMDTKVDDVLESRYDFDESDTGFKVFGGYKFFPWLSVEGAYINGGKPEVKETSDTGETGKLSIELQSIVASAVFTLPIGEKFELFVKPGIAFWDAKTTVRYRDLDFSDQFGENDNGSAFFLGGGAGLNITEHFGLRLEYEWFEAAPEYDSDENEFIDKYDATAGFFSASFIYSFAARAPSQSVPQTAAAPTPVISSEPTAVPTTPPSSKAGGSEWLGDNEFSVHQIAKANGCESPRLMSKTASTEVFSVTCGGGQTKVIQCEFTNCRLLQ